MCSKTKMQNRPIRSRRLSVWMTILAVILSGTAVKAQEDTAALIKSFYKVMAFASKPFVSYTGHFSLESQPILEPEDSASGETSFYKNQTDVYYKSGKDEMYLQDSFLIQIDHDKKTVWMSKVDIPSKSKLNNPVLNNRQLQQFMRQRYSIEELQETPGNSGLRLKSKIVTGLSTVVSSTIDLNFLQSDYRPASLVFEMRLQQPWNEELAGQIQQAGYNENKLYQDIGGKKFIVRTQRLTTLFDSIDYSPGKASEIPRWTEVLAYDTDNDRYTPRGNCAGYELTKTF